MLLAVPGRPKRYIPVALPSTTADVVPHHALLTVQLGKERDAVADDVVHGE